MNLNSITYLLLSAFILPLNAQTFPQPELWLRDTAAQVINPTTDSVLSYEVNPHLELFRHYLDKFPLITDTSHYNIEDVYEYTYGCGDPMVVITEQEFEAFIRNDRWYQYSSPSDTLRYLCVGKMAISDIYIVIVFCGWTPPKYLDTDFGYSQYLLSTFDADGNRISSLDLERRGDLDSVGHLPYDIDYESISYIGGNTHIDPDGKIQTTQLMIRFIDLFEKEWEKKVKRDINDYYITPSGEIDSLSKQ